MTHAAMSPALPMSWINVWMRDGSSVRVGMAHLADLWAAMRDRAGDSAAPFTDPGDRNDAALSLDTIYGETACVLASQVTGFLPSTPESRQADVAHTILLERERKQFTADAERTEYVDPQTRVRR